MNKAIVSITFDVSDVGEATEPLPEVPYHVAVSEFLQGPVESCSKFHGQLVKDIHFHPLIAALHAAFASHRPLTLSPDIIWLTIIQGLSIHINKNAEAVRNRFVSHQGKLEIAVHRDDFIKGSSENPWPEVFSTFSAQIRDHIGGTHDLIVADFSTTGPVERAASEIALFDSMQSYFSYILYTICGIPSITLEGTVEDWQSIESRVTSFSDFGLEGWVKQLLPILGQFVDAAAGQVDRDFWDSIYKWRGPQSSGGVPSVSGWIRTLFPYLCELRDRSFHYIENPWLGAPATEYGPQCGAFPNKVPKAPFRWVCMPKGNTYDMEFIGGLVGVSQDQKTLSLRPEVGWAVREGSRSKRPRPHRWNRWIRFRKG